MGDTSYDCLLHGFLLDPCPSSVMERRPDVNGDTESSSELNRPRHEDPSTSRCEFKHLRKRHLRQLDGARDDLGICGVHTIDIREYFASVCFQRGREGDRCCIGASSSESRNLLRSRINSLEASDNDDSPLI